MHKINEKQKVMKKLSLKHPHSSFVSGKHSIDVTKFSSTLSARSPNGKNNSRNIEEADKIEKMMLANEKGK